MSIPASNMIFFRYSAIICALFVLQAQAYPQEAHLGGVLDVIKDGVHAAEKVIDEVLNFGITGVEKLIKLANNLPADNEKLAKRLINFIGQITDREMEKLKEAVNDDAKAALECLDQNKEEWRAAETNLLVEFVTCSSTELANALTELKIILDELQTIQADAKSAASEIDQCEGEITEATTLLCVANVAKDLWNVAKTIPDILKENVEKLIDIVKNDAKVVVDCAKDDVQDFYQNGIIKIMNEIATCVKT